MTKSKKVWWRIFHLTLSVIQATRPYHSLNHLRMASLSIWLAHGDVIMPFQSRAGRLGVAAQRLRSGHPLVSSPLARAVLCWDHSVSWWKAVEWPDLRSEGCGMQSTMVVNVRLETRKYMSVWSDPFSSSCQDPICFPESSGTNHYPSTRALGDNSSRAQFLLSLETISKINNPRHHYIKKIRLQQSFSEILSCCTKHGPHYKEHHS